MGSASQDGPNVASMQEFIRETLRDMEATDQVLGRLRVDVRAQMDHLRGRLYALELADDKGLDAEVRQLADDLGAGRTPPTFSLDAVMERQGQ